MSLTAPLISHTVSHKFVKESDNVVGLLTQPEIPDIVPPEPNLSALFKSGHCLFIAL